MSVCPYCDEFDRGSLQLGENNYGNRILWEADNFTIFPDLSQLVEGYLLIASRTHYVGMGAMPSSVFEELEGVQDKVARVLAADYCSPFFFEHGPASESNKGASCIEHAHLHSVPLSNSDQARVLATVLREYPDYCRIDSLSELIRFYKAGQPYLLLQPSVGDRFVVPLSPNGAQSQYIRGIIANTIGKPERWNWRQHWDIGKLNSTLSKLRGKFK